jgi:hypothetical protein
MTPIVGWLCAGGVSITSLDLRFWTADLVAETSFSRVK